MTEKTGAELLVLTTQIVAAHVGHNRVAVAELSELIGKVYSALTDLGSGTEEPAASEQKPAISVRSSIKPDYIVCLEDGKRLTMLKRYLQTNYGMTPQQYRTKWKLPADYPMVAPNYAEKRRSLAKAIGLGRKPAPAPAPEPTPAPKARRGRRKAVAA
ncbi:MucR family transcriptional regulator [Sphingomonas nostoxanthinifaciens]|uniref:MucR family transcriptional regulator n=1 Tax=Sphingomonas nostoxanthinifaciens TaxID=2872652 RepID=UPI001CC20B86|nr:MucR family transcriptional regulator [Sphingomonas nostoxanthinifaciens]UAK24756.1 MucR family transcriptional regulator [Sphingomonas nostoxanthinifaciens]